MQGVGDAVVQHLRRGRRAVEAAGLGSGGEDLGGVVAGQLGGAQQPFQAAECLVGGQGAAVGGGEGAGRGELVEGGGGAAGGDLCGEIDEPVQVGHGRVGGEFGGLAVGGRGALGAVVVERTGQDGARGAGHRRGGLAGRGILGKRGGDDPSGVASRPRVIGTSRPAVSVPALNTPCAVSTVRPSAACAVAA